MEPRVHSEREAGSPGRSACSEPCLRAPLRGSGPLSEGAPWGGRLGTCSCVRAAQPFECHPALHVVLLALTKPSCALPGHAGCPASWTIRLFFSLPARSGNRSALPSPVQFLRLLWASGLLSPPAEAFLGPTRPAAQAVSQHAGQALWARRTPPHRQHAGPR